MSRKNRKTKTLDRVGSYRGRHRPVYRPTIRIDRVAACTTNTASRISQELDVVIYAASLSAPRHKGLDVLHFAIIVPVHLHALRNHTETGGISSHSIATNVASCIAHSRVMEGSPCRRAYRDARAIWM
jgi:hypothetical protein